MNCLRRRISWVPKMVVAYVGARGVPMAAPRIWSQWLSPNVALAVKKRVPDSKGCSRLPVQ
eukprot:5928307-Ditylum_brightwellii.AAC.1